MNLSIKMMEKYRGWIILAAVILSALALYWALYGNEKRPEINTGATLVGAMTQEEVRLSRILEAIEGAGKVEVLIFEESEPVQAVFSSGGSEYTAKGVIVCAQGADNLMVRLILQQAVSTALSLPADSIEIYKLAQEQKEE